MQSLQDIPDNQTQMSQEPRLHKQTGKGAGIPVAAISLLSKLVKKLESPTQIAVIAAVCVLDS